MRQEAFEQQPPHVVEVFVDQPLGQLAVAALQG
jgi:hypothetical protein